jgi:hypothetical protein
MVDLRSRQDRNRQSSATPWGDRVLLQTADRTVGMSNLATVPRAGNVSSDTRAG